MHFNIIGAGLSGLAAAIHLQKNGHTFTIIDASDKAGGRVKSDKIGGFILDHGFQIFLPSYPEAQAIMDYNKLNLQAFDPGALVLMENGERSIVKDPLRQPSSLLATLTSPIGSFSDKFKMLSLKSIAKETSSDISFKTDQMTTLEFLNSAGFSEKIINSFFRPFFSGVFFDNELETSAEMFKYLYNQFSISKASVPKHGMGALIENLLDQIPNDSIKLNEQAIEIEKGNVTGSSGNVYAADKCIIATEANELLERLKFKHNKKKRYSGTYYFSTDKAPYVDPLIGINARSNKAFNNIAVLSNVSPAYAPTGKHLVGISTIFANHQQTQKDILKECKSWFGNEVDDWKFLKAYEIPYSLPEQNKVRGTYEYKECKVNDHQFVCGDHMLYGSINAALKSGRLTVSHVLANL